MKKYILSILILLVLLLGSAIFLPYLFKDKIIEVIKTEANKNLKANLEFDSDIGINIFKSFPNLNLSLRSISVVYDENKFKNDTLFSSENLELSFDLMQFYQEKQYIFRSIVITKPKVNLEVLNDSTSNWDVLKPSTPEEETENNALRFELNSFKIHSASFSYLDSASDMQILLKNLNHSSSGNFNASEFNLASETSIAEFLFHYDNVPYVNNWAVFQKGDISVDLQKNKYSFSQNTLKFNGLKTTLDGYMELQEEDIIFDLTTSSSTPDLNEFLTLIPAIYTSDFKSIKTKGTGKMDATFKGIYNQTTFPSYNLSLAVDKGYFKYPDLDLPAKNIDFDLHIYSKDGNTDHTVVDIPKMHFQIGEDPFDLRLKVQDIHSNALIDATANGTINLSNISKIIPLENTQLSGNIVSNLAITGRVDDISASAIDKFQASGRLYTNDLIYQTSDMNKRLTVKKASVMVKNQRIQIPELNGTLGKNDIDFSGTFDNFFSYLLSDKKLKGKATITSNYLNTNDFISDGEDESENIEMTLVEIPGNMELDLSTSVKNLHYDDLNLNNFTGQFKVINKILKMKDVSTNLLGGRVNLKGAYEYDEQKPLANFDITYSDIEIAELLSKFKIIKAFAPIASQIQALTTAKLNITTELNKDMSPKLGNINVGGSINLENIIVQNLEVLKGIDTKLGTSHFNIKKLKDMLLKFSIKDGKLLVEPFNLFIDSSRISMNGLSKLDGSIAYNGILSIPGSYIKNETSIINSLTKGSAFQNLQLNPKDYFNIAISVDGDYKNPKVKLNLREIKKSLKQKVKSAINNEVEKTKQQAKETATKELNKIKEETAKRAEDARKKLQEELNQKKKEAANRLRQEAEDRKKKLKEEAEKKLKGLFNN